MTGDPSYEGRPSTIAFVAPLLRSYVKGTVCHLCYGEQV